MKRCYHGDCPCLNWAATACCTCTSQVLIQFLYYPSLKMHFQRSTTVDAIFNIHREMLPQNKLLHTAKPLHKLLLNLQPLLHQQRVLVQELIVPLAAPKWNSQLHAE